MNARFQDPPYLITLVIGLLSWVLTYYIERVQESPLIEYELIEVTNKSSIYWLEQGYCNEYTNHDLKLYLFKLKNLSNKMKFDDITLHAKIESGSVVSARIIPIAPAMAGRSPAVCSGKSATYPSLSLNPLAEIHLLAVSYTHLTLPTKRIV